MKKFFVITCCLAALVAASCGDSEDQFNDTNGLEMSNTEPVPVYNFVFFEDEDTVVSDYAICRYIPINQIDDLSKVRIVPYNEYVCYHDDDSTGIVFNRTYISNLLLNSKCSSKVTDDSVWVYHFLEANLGFVRDSDGFIKFGWYGDSLYIYSGYPNFDYPRTEEILSVLEDDYYKTIFNNPTNAREIWDLIRCVEKSDDFKGIIENGNAIFVNGNGLKIVCKYPFNVDGITMIQMDQKIYDKEILIHLNKKFLSKLSNIKLNQGLFIEPYE